MIYVVIHSDDQNDFEIKVSEKMKEGYIPTGGVFIIQNKIVIDDNTWYEQEYYQALVRT